MAYRKSLDRKVSGNYTLRMTHEERAALDRAVDQVGVDTATFLRVVIDLIDRGEITVPSSAFDDLFEDQQ